MIWVLKAGLFYILVALFTECLFFVEMRAGRQPKMRENPWVMLWASLLWPIVVYNTYLRSKSEEPTR